MTVGRLSVALVVVGLVIKLEDWCDREQRPLLGGGFIRWSPIPSFCAFAFVRDEIVRFHRSISGRLCGSRLELSGSLPRRGRVARGEWGRELASRW